MKILSHIIYIFAIISFAFCTACASDKKEKPDETVQQLLPDAPAEVTTITLKTVDFEHELVSNGKISARTVAELKFQTTEVIAHIFVKNGSRVSPGQRIAMFDTSFINSQVEQVQNTLDRSLLRCRTCLSGRGTSWIAWMPCRRR